MADNLGEETYDAMVEFLGTFPSLTEQPPEDMIELSDGVALFEALSEIAPDYFDPSTIAHNLGENWALKSSNLRKLIRNLEQFYHYGLSKDAATFTSLNVSAMARKNDPVAISLLVELVIAAAVTCPDKSTFVGRIMGMSQENQLQMKTVIEHALGGLTDWTDGDGEEEFDVDDGEVEMDFAAGTPAAPGSGLWAGHTAHANVAELEKALEEARRELSSYKSQATLMAEDSQSSQKKLRALVEDLQDRLETRQVELNRAEKNLKTVTIELDDSKAKVTELEEKTTQLEDDLDLANAKTEQLRRAEATVVSYRKKLESVGVLNQSISELEDQSASYLRQIVELESDVKKIPALNKQIEELQEKLASMHMSQEDAGSAMKGTASEIAELKSSLNAAESAKKMYEEELKELRAQQEAGVDDDDDVGGVSLAAASASGTSASKEVARLEFENKKLEEQIQDLIKSKSEAVAAAANADAGTASEVIRLKESLSKSEAEKAKITSDKDKLEAYTKRTLAKFQEKYLVALQECKAKLKEKQDKIEALENRSASEKTAQKREERLLSSTIYELGLAIMQNRLKER